MNHETYIHTLHLRSILRFATCTCARISHWIRRLGFGFGSSISIRQDNWYFYSNTRNCLLNIEGEGKRRIYKMFGVVVMKLGWKLFKTATFFFISFLYINSEMKCERVKIIILFSIFTSIPIENFHLHFILSLFTHDTAHNSFSGPVKKRIHVCKVKLNCEPVNRICN